MISNIPQYKSYFESLAVSLGCSFVYANRGRVLAKQLSQIEYPLLWLPVPEVRLNLADGKQYIFQGAAVFLTHADADDYEGQDAALNNMLSLATQAVQQMEADSADNFIFDPLAVEMNHVAHWSADNNWGWKIEFELGGSNFC